MRQQDDEKKDEASQLWRQYQSQREAPKKLNKVIFGVAFAIGAIILVTGLWIILFR